MGSYVGTKQYKYGGSESVPCNGKSKCTTGGNGIGVDGVIAAFWCDLWPGSEKSGGIYHGAWTDSQGAKFYVVEYRAVTYWYDVKKDTPDKQHPANTFQILLGEDGAVRLQYKNIPG